ncbi:MAG: hypothetical protein AB1696_09810 [Planctomycetota bacterium]
MSIYATLWTLKFPRDGDDYTGCEWIQVRAQGVPAHIGSPTPGSGYENGDPYASFLPPPVVTDANGSGPHLRAVVFVTEGTVKGTERSPQEYAGPLLVLSGEEYARMSFEELHGRLCEVLRGNRAPVVAEVLRPDGKHKIIRARLKEDHPPNKRKKDEQ